MSLDATCPVCSSQDHHTVYSVDAVPVHAVILHRSQSSAENADRARLDIRYCRECSMIWNQAFDSARMDYGPDYEETQAYSETFNAFHRDLAARLVDRYGLTDARVLEIGCGKGEFLAELADCGIGRGIGYDPSFRPERLVPRHNLEFHQCLFPPVDGAPEADFYICKMTLEHIHHPAQFLEDVVRHIGSRSATLFFMVPGARRILEEGAFWDIYYEHCNYFCAASLQRLFADRGLDILSLGEEFNGQYLAIAATWRGAPSGRESRASHLVADSEIAALIDRIPQKVDRLRQLLSRGSAGTLIWGAASKACALLNVLPELQAHCELVDINPNKRGTWLPGTALEIRVPEDFRGRTFERVLVCNPVYANEIATEMRRLDINGTPVMLD